MSLKVKNMLNISDFIKSLENLNCVKRVIYVKRWEMMENGGLVGRKERGEGTSLFLGFKHDGTFVAYVEAHCVLKENEEFVRGYGKIFFYFLIVI
jgi:hypothetical protein